MVMKVLHGLGDLGSNLLARELDVALEKQLDWGLQPVQRALKKIEDGPYGLCENTGKPIHRVRLEVALEAI
jgi:RNA polymerase-binding transcription factor DksA